MGLFFLAVVTYKEAAFPTELGLAIGLIFLELALITAVAIFFSSFTTPYLAAMFTVGLWIIGHLLADIRDFGELPGSESLKPITNALYWSLPNLDRLDIKADAAAGNPIEMARIWGAALYAVLYSTGLLIAATFLFQRRDFR